MTYDEIGLPEGDLHWKAKVCARDALRGDLESPEATSYTAILPNSGLYESRVLGLDVQVEQDRLRFYAGTALLLESEEFIVRLQAMAEDAQRRAEEEARLREEETRRREEAERRREEAEQEVARLRVELDRLKR